jgi:peptidoglycan/LPS O-acetylase OafA/YrhL
MSEKKLTQRNFGLDIIRSLAIMMVLICHFMLLNKNSSVFIKKVSFLFGIYGVELFFVLSGFLIGKILINLFYKDNYISHIKMFYLRRWFRTLPLYYLALIISSIILIFNEPNTNIFSPFYLKYIFLYKILIQGFIFFLLKVGVYP